MTGTDMGNQRGLDCVRSGNEQGGFTIIEVILFLAISAMLLTGAMIGVSANINNSRFNDAIHSTTSFIQSQYDEVAAGRNDRADGLSCDASLNITTASPKNPGMTQCAVLGRFIKLAGTDLTSRYIIGYWSSLDDLPSGDNDALRDSDMKLRVASDQSFGSTYQIPWNIGIRKTTPSSAPPSLGLAIIRSPVTGNILYYTFATTSPEPSLDQSTVITATNLNQSVDLCFDDDTSGRFGHIKLNPGQGQEVIQDDLSTAAGPCS